MALLLPSEELWVDLLTDAMDDANEVLERWRDSEGTEDGGHRGPFFSVCGCAHANFADKHWTTQVDLSTVSRSYSTIVRSQGSAM